MSFILPASVDLILDTLSISGFEAFIVGGCVRDFMLGKIPTDYDICTNANPTEIKTCFRNYFTIDTGIKHGTVTVVIDNVNYEITSYRTDGDYSDHRRPDSVIFVRNLSEDLKRRDFTINAMAYNHSNGVVDNHGGIKDLEYRIVRAVGNPDTRFNEDALRIMRAVRFASCLSFKIESSTSDAIHRLCHLLKNISVERINVELCKLLLGDGADDILLTYSDVISAFIPEFREAIGFEQNNPYHKYNIYEHIIRSVGSAPKCLTVRLALLLHDIGKPTCHTRDEKDIDHFIGHEKISVEISTKVLNRLRFNCETIKNVTELIKYHGAVIQPVEKHVKRFLNRLGEEQFFRLMQVKYSDTMAQSDLISKERIDQNNEIIIIGERIIAENQCFKIKDLAINGSDIIELGIPQGKKVGELLSTLLDMVMDGSVENKSDCLVAELRRMTSQK